MLLAIVLIFILGLGIGFLVGFFGGDGGQAFFKYKTRVAELKAEETERMEDYIKSQRKEQNNE